LDIRLRDGKRENSGSASLGFVNSHLSWEGPLSERSSFMFSLRKMYYDLVQDALDANSTSPRYNFYDMSTKFSFNAGSENIISLSAFLSADNVYSPHSSDIEYDIQWKNAALSLSWIQLLSNARISNTSLSYVSYQFRSVLNDTIARAGSADYYSVSHLQDLQLKKDFEVYFATNMLGKIGIDAVFHNYNLKYSDVFTDLLDYSEGKGKGIMSFEAAAFIQAQWQILPFLKANLGSRIYYFNEEKTVHPEPRLSLVYNLTDDLDIKCAYASAHQFLHLVIRNDISLPTDLWYPSAGNIEPESSEQYVFGIQKNFENNIYQMTLETYYKRMHNLYEFKDNLVFNPGNSVVDLFTKGEGEAYGMEFYLGKTEGEITGWIGYTLSWTRRKFDELNYGRLFYPRFDRRHDISLVLSYAVTDNFNIGATWTYASGQGFTLPVSQYFISGIDADPSGRIQFDYTARNEYKLPAYHRLDLNIVYKFNWGRYGMETYFNITNAYNRNNPFAYYASLENKNSGTVNVKYPVFHSISLFPFIPAAGVKIRF
ncbi:MAG: TonB-dependent receptor plug domain-containing protein, partial [Syntrophothermus sp.]